MINRNYTTSLFLAVLVLLAGGCNSLASQPFDSEFPRHHPSAETPENTQHAPMTLLTAERLSYPLVREAAALNEEEMLYSFVINNMDVKEGLRLFARAYDLNVAVDQDVAGVLDAEFRDVPLEKAMSLLLDNLDYYWQLDDGVIRVRSQETRRFSIDYLRLVRGGVGSSTATVASSSGDSGEGGGSGETDAGSISINQQDEIKFWEELEAQLRDLLSTQGRMVVNRLSGTVQINDQHAYVEDVGQYIEHINRAIHRQVDIEVRILEISLDDSTALGVNWARVSEVLDSGVNVDFSLDGVVTSAAGGLPTNGPVLTLDAVNLKNDGNQRLGAVVEALQQQGDVEIVSQPHVRTLNNQTSLIKVGTDRTFFRREQSTDSTSAGSITTATDIPQVVTEGVVLSITPQISDEGWVMMDVSPVVTRVSSVSVVEGVGGNIQSSAPNLDVAQVSSLIRAKSGDTVVIGGLIQTQSSRTKKQLPGMDRLGGVGRFLGTALGGYYDATVKKELIMVLTPTIVTAN